ncbi:MAG: hypothetical protein ACOYN2_04430 [Patescibacteria group bacterium]
MKTLLTVGLVLVTTAFGTTSSFAMSMDSMQKDVMMKSDTMTMTNTHMSVSALAKSKGYNWMKDRSALATKAGIKNYRGTAAQNLIIKKYLMNGAMMKSDTMMK